MGNKRPGTEGPCEHLVHFDFDSREGEKLLSIWEQSTDMMTLYLLQGTRVETEGPVKKSSWHRGAGVRTCQMLGHGNDEDSLRSRFGGGRTSWVSRLILGQDAYQNAK